MSDLDPALARWEAQVRAALDLGDPVDLDEVLGTAGVVAHGVLRPAAPVTTYLIGVAVGRAVASGADADAAFTQAVATVRRLLPGSAA